MSLTGISHAFHEKFVFGYTSLLVDAAYSNGRE